MLRSKLVPVLVLALLISATIFGTIYAVAQQSIRLGQNDEQIQWADAVASKLASGTKPGVVLSFFPLVDMATSHAPFIIIYDKATGDVLTTSGELNNDVPDLPSGVLQHASTGSYNMVTWQPQKGVRLATVTTATDKYYVLAGRSLAGPEHVTSQLGQLCLLGGVVLFVLLGGGYWLLSRRPAQF